MTAVALIPPIDLLHYVVQRPLQMVLPACFKSATYRRAYEKPRHSYVILDNGMFESDRPMSNTDLLNMAAKYNVQEVVMPDVRGDAYGTANLVRGFLLDYTGWQQKTQRRFRLMAVVQGKDFDERTDCLYSLAGALATEPDAILGFPRRLTEEAPSARLDIMERARQMYNNTFELHMLGMSRQWPGEFLMARHRFGNQLRGIDTDAPFVWASRRAPLSATALHYERPMNYFTLTETMIPLSMLDYNISVLESWAEGLSVRSEARSVAAELPPFGA